MANNNTDTTAQDDSFQAITGGIAAGAQDNDQPESIPLLSAKKHKKPVKPRVVIHQAQEQLEQRLPL